MWNFWAESSSMFLCYIIGWLLLLRDAFATMSVEGQLFQDLLFTYNKAIRPAPNATDVLEVKFASSLIRIIDIDSKNQVLTTNLWLEMQWQDNKLNWDPLMYDGIMRLRVPSDLLWLPDVVLYKNAQGKPDITIDCDAIVYFDGTVVWRPPAIFKSFCEIDVMWFPYDVEECLMKFGLWTHTGGYVDLQHLNESAARSVSYDGNQTYESHLDEAMDLSYYHLNAEWDLLRLNGSRHAVVYGSCCGTEVYIDITYQLTLRRKPLFFTVNLMIPCALISFLTTYVFYLPAHSGDKLTFSISILVTLTVFFLVLIDLIPPTSVVIPLFGKFLLFTMMLITLSIIISVVTVNLHHRNGTTHIMPKWIRIVFLGFLIKLLRMERPDEAEAGETRETDMPVVGCVSSMANVSKSMSHATRVLVEESSLMLSGAYSAYGLGDESLRQQVHEYRKALERTLANVKYIADHFRQRDAEDEVSNDWTYVSMALDRLFLILFTIANIVGTLAIIFQAPAFFDDRKPLGVSNPTRPLGSAGDMLSPPQL